MTSSTVPRRLLGRSLQQLREASGVSIAEAGRAIESSKQTIWRIESAQVRALKMMYVQRLCELYGATPEVTRALVGLAEETKRDGWWHAYSDAIPAHFDLYLGLEAAANRLTTWQLTLLPGLLQTQEYRRAMIWTTFPNLSTADVARRIELSHTRQTRLVGSELTLEAYVSEAVLRHHVGGSRVMADQLKHLAFLAELGNVTIKVLPMRSGGHLGLGSGGFVLMEFPVHPTSRMTEPPVVYVESHTGALYLEKESELMQYRTVVASIRNAALPQSTSRAMFLKIAKEYEDEC